MCDRDASLLLAKMELNPSAVAGMTYADLTPAEVAALDNWVSERACVCCSCSIVMFGGVLVAVVHGCMPLVHVLLTCAIVCDVLQVSRLREKYTIVGYLTDGVVPRSVESEGSA